MASDDQRSTRHSHPRQQPMGNGRLAILLTFGLLVLALVLGTTLSLSGH